MEFIELENLILTAFFLLLLFAMGVACGMYISSQIEKHIDKRVKNGNK
jgi:HAMP domain-containing protein